jgi:Glycosyl hydrolase family 47
MLVSAYSGVYNHSREGEWYADVDMNTNHQHKHHQRRVFESLMAFYPGMQVLLGEVTPAAKSANAFFLVREWLGFLPERFAYPQWRVDAGRGAGKHPLRPELLESSYFLHRATRGINNDAKSSGWQWASDFALHKLEKVARVRCGYAGVTNLAQDTTGDLDSTSRNVYLMDDMPSFFMSETLKYLYLTFDDDNVLHRDDDRDWIFTTEAHPFHAVESVSDAEKRFVAERSALKQILRDRLQKRARPRRHTSSHHQSLKSEKWSDKTSLKGFVSKLESEEKEALLHRVQLTKDPRVNSDLFFSQRRLVSPFVPDNFCPTEFLNDTRQHANLAHLSPTNLGVGQGTLLKRSCPNVYSSELLWVHALNGGALDYTELFASVSRDSLEDHPIDFAVLGAAEALGALGTGLYLGTNALLNKDESCPLPESRADRHSLQGESEDTDKPRTTPAPGETIQLKTEEFGVFELSPEPDGGGFFIQLIDTGETIATTFYEQFAMISSFAPTVPRSPDPDPGQSPWRRMGSRFSSIFGSKDTSHIAPPPKASSPDGSDGGIRRLLLADFDGNTFSCEVEVFETYPEAVHDADVTEQDEKTAEEEDADQAERETRWVEEVLGVVPCAPARFALTAIEELVKSGGISIQARTVAPPHPDDEHGCRSLSDEDHAGHGDDARGGNVVPAPPDEHDTLVRLVHRGGCSFYAKSVNQRLASNADGVIVINDHDDEVFVMTATVGDELVVVDPQSVPVTVLVSGSDGEALMDMISVDKDDDEATVGIRISITRQPSHLYGSSESTASDNNDNSNNNANDDGIDWPFVVGSEGSLSAFARTGWGIQATRKPGREDWQLQLLRRPT